MIKLIAISERLANKINERKDFESVTAGRAVIMNMNPTDARIPSLKVEAHGYLEKCTDWDIAKLLNEVTK